MADVSERFELEPVFTVKSEKRPAELPAEKTEVARTISRRPVPFPLVDKFMSPALKTLFLSGADLPTSPLAAIKPAALPALCLCKLPYDQKDIQPTTAPFRVLYQLGPASKPVTMFVAKCQNDKRDCDVFGDGAGTLIWVCTPQLGIAEPVFYDTLLSVCFALLLVLC